MFFKISFVLCFLPALIAAIDSPTPNPLRSQSAIPFTSAQRGILRRGGSQQQLDEGKEIAHISSSDDTHTIADFLSMHPGLSEQLYQLRQQHPDFFRGIDLESVIKPHRSGSANSLLKKKTHTSLQEKRLLNLLRTIHRTKTRAATPDAFDLHIKSTNGTRGALDQSPTRYTSSEDLHQRMESWIQAVANVQSLFSKESSAFVEAEQLMEQLQKTNPSVVQRPEQITDMLLTISRRMKKFIDQTSMEISYCRTSEDLNLSLNYIIQKHALSLLRYIKQSCEHNHFILNDTKSALPRAVQQFALTLAEFAQINTELSDFPDDQPELCALLKKHNETLQSLLPRLEQETEQDIFKPFHELQVWADSIVAEDTIVALEMLKQQTPNEIVRDSKILEALNKLVQELSQQEQIFITAARNLTRSHAKYARVLTAVRELRALKSLIPSNKNVWTVEIALQFIRAFKNLAPFKSTQPHPSASFFDNYFGDGSQSSSRGESSSPKVTHSPIALRAEIDHSHTHYDRNQGNRDENIDESGKAQLEAQMALEENRVWLDTEFEACLYNDQGPAKDFLANRCLKSCSLIEAALFTKHSLLNSPLPLYMASLDASPRTRDLAPWVTPRWELIKIFNDLFTVYSQSPAATYFSESIAQFGRIGSDYLSNPAAKPLKDLQPINIDGQLEILFEIYTVIINRVYGCFKIKPINATCIDTSPLGTNDDVFADIDDELFISIANKESSSTAQEIYSEIIDNSVYLSETQYGPLEAFALLHEFVASELIKSDYSKTPAEKQQLLWFMMIRTMRAFFGYVRLAESASIATSDQPLTDYRYAKYLEEESHLHAELGKLLRSWTINTPHLNDNVDVDPKLNAVLESQDSLEALGLSSPIPRPSSFSPCSPSAQ